MAYTCIRPDFSVVVEGGHGADGVWSVRGNLIFHRNAAVPAFTDVQAEAQLELTLGVVREALRGRDAGARHLHVTLDGDRNTGGFILGLQPRPAPRGSCEPTPRAQEATR
jgi:hypothetical protein